MYNDMGLIVPLSSKLSVTCLPKIGFADAGSHQADQAVWKLLSASNFNMHAHAQERRLKDRVQV